MTLGRTRAFPQNLVGSRGCDCIREFSENVTHAPLLICMMHVSPFSRFTPDIRLCAGSASRGNLRSLSNLALEFPSKNTDIDRAPRESRHMAYDGKHVIPRPNGGWSVRQSGAARASKTFQTQADAVDYARGIARKDNADLYVHRRDGSVQHKDSYKKE